MAIQFGYCTNVHAGSDLPQTRANLERYALAVRRRVSPQAPLGIGLWLAGSAARALLEGERLPEFRDWLAESGLVPFTLNGFPYGDFHQTVVKHRVYEPTWAEPARLEYTLSLITILDKLLPASMEGSISTLPIMWGQPYPSRALLLESARALQTVAVQLSRLEQESGRCICLCLEPEPGCVLQYSADVVSFFEEYLLPEGDEQAVRRHLRICHDVCHAAVMFEDQADVLHRYRAAGLAVGKVQVSSAVAMPLDKLTSEDRSPARKQLAGFAEDRYLHQTVVHDPVSGANRFFEDLNLALATPEASDARDEWRVHFHVPIYLQKFGLLTAMQQPIRDCLALAATTELTRHFEVETYAWGVLPPELRQPDLAAGIADELAWFVEAWKVATST